MSRVDGVHVWPFSVIPVWIYRLNLFSLKKYITTKPPNHPENTQHSFRGLKLELGCGTESVGEGLFLIELKSCSEKEEACETPSQALVDWEGRGRVMNDWNVKFRPSSVEDCSIPVPMELKDKKLSPCVSWQRWWRVTCVPAGGISSGCGCWGPVQRAPAFFPLFPCPLYNVLTKGAVSADSCWFVISNPRAVCLKPQGTHRHLQKRHLLHPAKGRFCR